MGNNVLGANTLHYRALLICDRI